MSVEYKGHEGSKLGVRDRGRRRAFSAVNSWQVSRNRENRTRRREVGLVPG